MKPLIQVQAVSQRFNTASGEFLALQNVSFDIYEGETVSLIGPLRLRQIDAAESDCRDYAADGRRPAVR
ncbi:ABC-type spermidine/putrescine transport systems, ATPase components [Raoultella terrigena]|uniref:ABC-type spermidine/putrescine transport systems, ATPase components n=1 Tax=Raoultella terrigena TaxID=577 RepID=A0A485BNE9_RAOTE|nr:ABC-type spermidine/putrescine transport systems, ATPase components [Raoultella terrigena]